MKRKRNIVDVFKRTRSQARRISRLLFPSPAEMVFIEVMGGAVVRFGFRHPRSKSPLAIVVRKPDLFKAEMVRREVRAGSKYIDFANDIGRGVEIQGAQYHRDVVEEFDRDSYLYQRGWRMLYIDAVDLYTKPSAVYKRTYDFFIK